jgi:hypothetical protein
MMNPVTMFWLALLGGYLCGGVWGVGAMLILAVLINLGIRWALWANGDEEVGE